MKSLFYKRCTKCFDIFCSLNRYIPLYKLNQDFVELFFGKLRRRYGNNNNPNTCQVEAGVKSLLAYDIEASMTGNATLQEHIALSPLGTLKTILGQSENEISDENEDGDPFMFEENDWTQCHASEQQLRLVENISVYIAGFVGRSLCKKLSCSKCVTLLIATDITTMRLRSDFILLSRKDQGGLFYPSATLVAICKCTEKIIRALEPGGTQKISMKKVEVLTLRDCYAKGFLQSLSHSELFRTDSCEIENHSSFLAKKIVQSYAGSRLRHMARQASLDLVPKSSRNYYHQLTNLKGE